MSGIGPLPEASGLLGSVAVYLPHCLMSAVARVTILLWAILHIPAPKPQVNAWYDGVSYLRGGSCRFEQLQKRVSGHGKAFTEPAFQPELVAQGPGILTMGETKTRYPWS